jgi:hypothetical protein
MALIYRLKCLSCSYAKEFSEGAMILLADDGSEHVCHFPAQAEEFSKRPFAELERTARVFRAAPAWCEKCGSVGYYRRKARGGRLETQARRAAWLEGLKCNACGQAGLLPATDNLGPWGGCGTVGLLFNLAGWPAVIFHPLWAIPGLTGLVGFLLWWRKISKRERARWRQLSCPACRVIGIEVAIVGIS